MDALAYVYISFKSIKYILPGIKSLPIIYPLHIIHRSDYKIYKPAHTKLPTVLSAALHSNSPESHEGQMVDEPGGVCVGWHHIDSCQQSSSVLQGHLRRPWDWWPWNQMWSPRYQSWTHYICKIDHCLNLMGCFKLIWVNCLHGHWGSSFYFIFLLNTVQKSTQFVHIFKV